MKTDMNISDHDGRTALHAAVERNQENVVDFLIKCKVSPFVRWRYVFRNCFDKAINNCFVFLSF